MITIQNPKNVELAYNRISNYLIQTPILESEVLNNQLGTKIYFKSESPQHTGAFKVRGVLNHLLQLKELGSLPKNVVAYTTGNHGIGLSWVSSKLGINSRIYFPANTSIVKRELAKSYGAEVIITNTRFEAEMLAKTDGDNGYYYLHPSDSDFTIAGAGTMCYEALKQINFTPDAIFGSCGGGGLLSGTYLAKEFLTPSAKVIGAEPENANDAFRSLQEGLIFSFTESPDTIADGLRTLHISERTFCYLKKLDDFYVVSENEIGYWTNQLTKHLNIPSEPSCAINLGAVRMWLEKNKASKILVLLSGGNV
jgi:threonine dehydratase